MTTIYISDFQPFESRRGKDTVKRLRFEYDPELIAFLKAAIRNYKDHAIDPSRNIFQPGGWRPAEKCWWVEQAIWPMVKRDLEGQGYWIEQDGCQ